LGLDRLIVEVHRLHIDKDVVGRTPLKEWSARRRGRYPHNTPQTQETNMHAVKGIRTPGTSNQAASDLQLKRQGHRDWLLI